MKLSRCATGGTGTAAAGAMHLHGRAVRLDSVGNCIGMNWDELGWMGMDWDGLGWIGMEWDGL
eukprot:SAG31_NODE_13336_length_876_cov_1.021879_2_plen_62_part_01